MEIWLASADSCFDESSCSRSKQKAKAHGKCKVRGVSGECMMSNRAKTSGSGERIQ